MSRLSFKQLEAFVQVADLSSFRRAAERLNTTQPNISSRIASLEARLGLKLFDRNTGSVNLTQAGETLLPKSRRVLSAHDDFVFAAGNKGLFEGSLRLGVTEMIVHSWLGDYLKALKDTFPKLDIDLTVDYSVNLSEALFNRSLDLALQSRPFDRDISGSIGLGSYPMVWVSAPDLGLNDKIVSAAELSRHPVLSHGRDTVPFKQLRKHFSDQFQSMVRLFPSNNMSACLQMTRDGLGIACLPEVMVRREVERKDLAYVKYPWAPDDLWFEARYDAETSPIYVEEAAVLASEVAGQLRQTQPD